MTARGGVLVVKERPLVTMDLDNMGNIYITVASIDDEFERCQVKEVSFPVECVEAVVSTMLKLRDQHGAR